MEEEMSKSRKTRKDDTKEVTFEPIGRTSKTYQAHWRGTGS